MDDRRRRKAHSSAAFEEDKNMALKNSNDHWAFLEEIEAPMWVDLTLEANSTNQHIDDDWFYRSHLFHQCSSRQLKAAFSNSGEDSIGLNFDLVGPSSPQLPSSVSKSRGKDFVSKKWRGENQDFADKRHLDKVLSGTSSCGNSGSSDKMKPKSSFIQLKGTSSSKSSSVCKSSLTTNHIPSCSKPTSSGGDPTCSLSSVTNKADESSTTSTITSEIGQQQQQQKFMEKSNPVLSQTNGIFSVIKAGFRKSGITRPAARVEINGDRRQSRVHKSSSSKSSVGSSSNPRSEGRASTSTSIQYKERTPDSRNVARMSYATKNRIRPSKVSKPSNHKIERGAANNRMGPNVSKSVHVEAAKPKVQYQIQRRKPLESVRVNENKSTTATVKSKEKPVVGGSNRMAASGKENVKGKMAGSQKCSNKGIAPVTMVWSPKGTKQSILQRTARTGLAGKTVLLNNLITPTLFRAGKSGRSKPFGKPEGYSKETSFQMRDRDQCSLTDLYVECKPNISCNTGGKVGVKQSLAPVCPTFWWYHFVLVASNCLKNFSPRESFSTSIWKFIF